MKIAIHYFSGCGNTAWVVDKAQKKLQASGHEIVLMQNVEMSFPTQMPSSDVDIFMAPTYFFGLPANFVAYLKRLPMVAGRKAIFWSVNGGMPGASKMMAGSLLKDRGYEFIAGANVEMPDTFLFLKQSQLTPDERKEVLMKALSQIDENLKALDVLPPMPKDNMLKNVFFGFVYMLYYVMIRHTMGLSFVSNSKCIHCGWCAQHCPVAAIAFDGQKPHWKTGCVGCFRCLNHCPVAAIDFSMYAVLCSAVGAIGGAMIIGDIFSFLGIISKLAGLFIGWFIGSFVFQKVSSLFSADKMLCLADKKRVFLTDEEKSYSKDDK